MYLLFMVSIEWAAWFMSLCICGSKVLLPNDLLGLKTALGIIRNVNDINVQRQT